MAVDKLKRLPNESDFEYHKRLVYGKLENGLLGDVDYAELAPYVYGKNFSSDVARRMMYGSKRTLDLLTKNKEEEVCDTAAIDKMEQSRLEMLKEKKRLQDQRREYNKMIAAEGRWEHLETCLVESANHLAETVGRCYDPVDDPRDIFLDNEDCEAVLVISDIHYGMVTDNIYNRYNTDIAAERLKTVVKAAASRIAMHGAKCLHVLLLGDACHGAIVTSARVASEELVADQMMHVSELLAQSLDYLSDVVPNIYVYCTYGNHMRTVANKRDSVHRDNMERLIGWWLDQRMKGNERVTVLYDLPTEFVQFESCGYSFVGVHGDLDNVRKSTLIIPPLFEKYEYDCPKYILMGDKHHHESFEQLGVKAIVCGSLCGTDDYANQHRLYSEPEQLLLIVTGEAGVDAEYHLRCQ